LNAQTLTVDLGGFADAKADGSATTMSVKSAGSGKAFLPNLSATEADGNLSGTGDASLRVSARLSLKNYGPVKILCHGSPTLSALVFGSVSVVCLGAN
jgi:hypothetical protein